MKTNILLVSAFLCFQSLGCSDSRCGGGQVRVDGNCIAYDAYIAAARGASSGGASSGGADSGGRSGADSGGASTANGGGPSQEVEFGGLCTAHTDCGGDSNYCATPPGEPAYCTISGCDATPDICPAGFQCFDLAQFVPGEPFICLKAPSM